MHNDTAQDGLLSVNHDLSIIVLNAKNMASIDSAISGVYITFVSMRAGRGMVSQEKKPLCTKNSSFIVINLLVFIYMIR